MPGYSHGKPHEFGLYLGDMKPDVPSHDTGIPRPATGEAAKRILDRVELASAISGTQDTIENGGETIRP